MSDRPRVSILMPCYNHEAFLEDCITSILAQTHQNIELLICDDCSPDNSYSVICSYIPALQARFPRVEVLRNPTNCGVTKNINRMLAMATGDYIKILASDDALAPKAIETMVRFFADNPQFDVVIANGIRVSEEEHLPNFTPVSQIYDTPPDFSAADFFARTARRNQIFAPGAMLRRSVFETYGYYDETIPVEDMEYWLRLLKNGTVLFGYIDEALIYYRINGNSMSSTANNPNLEKRRCRMHFAVIDTLNKHRDGFEPGIWEEISLMYMLNERSFAIDAGLTGWASELRKLLLQFPGWKALSGGLRLHFMYRMLKMDIRALLGMRS